MRKSLWSMLPALLACAAIAGQGYAAEEHRQLGAHVHGHGKLNIAVEGSKVSLDLDAPGVDIVGTESFADEKAKAAALTQAQQLFADPLKQFVVPAAAGCKVASSKVEFEGEDHEDNTHAAAAHDHEHESEGHQHADISAEFELTCANPAALTTIEFKYFDTFKTAQALSVAIITPKGQTSSEVTRAAPRLDLAGLM